MQVPDPVKDIESMIANLPTRTGRSLDEWVALVDKAGLDKHRAITTFLTSEHGMTGGYANLIALTVLRSPALADHQDPVDMIYAGKNAGLRPLHDAVLGAVSDFGPVESAPKKAWVSLRRSKQFAMVGPGTRGRLDVCLNLPDLPLGGRMEEMTGMASRRVRLSSMEEVDDELVGWLRAAYDRS